MGYLSLVLTLWIIFMLSPPGQAVYQKYGWVGAVGIIVGLFVVSIGPALLLAKSVSETVAYRLFTGWGGDRRSSRRRIGGRTEGIRTAKERKLDAMEDAELEAFFEANPEDALAAEILAERLKGGGDLQAYASAEERALRLEDDMSIEEKCKRYNELADLYLGSLAQPRKAAEMLQAIVAEFPNSYQATLSRDRIARARAAAQEPPKTGSRW